MHFAAFGKLMPYPIPKTLLRMKLTAIFIFLFVLQSMAETFAQVTIREKNLTLEKVLQTIKKQSGYDLVYQKELIRTKGKPVSIHLSNVSLNTALELIFREQELDYELVGKIITVKERKVTISSPNSFSPNLPLQKEIVGIDVKGKVVNESGEALAGISVIIKGTKRGTTTDDKGYFELKDVNADAVLQISGVNIESYETKLNGRTELNFTAKAKIYQLQGVEITSVSTGYQTIPKERATGSFVQVDNALLNRSVSTDVLSRLDGVASGLVFNRFKAGNNPISIRGQSTLFANPNPLIVIDNFPFDGDINNINPNDVESITLLKDASAASIWGARAGNGVIVITTKRGRLNQPLKLSLNSNTTFQQRPDLFYVPQVSSSDYIDNEIKLFDNGFYAASEASLDKIALTPVVELLIKKRDGLLPANVVDAQINELRSKDVRKEIDKYFTRDEVRQQHAISLQGGTSLVNYHLLAGYDKNLNSQIANSYERMTLSSQVSVVPVKNIELTVGYGYTKGVNENNTPNDINFAGGPLYPYAQFADNNGNPLPIEKNYRSAWIQSLSQQPLLNWYYRPLDELRLSNNSSSSINQRINLGINYKFLKSLSIDFKYLSQRTSGYAKNYQDVQTYNVRNLINRFSVVSGSTITRPVPLGGILDESFSSLVSDNIRLQINYNKTIGAHQIAAIAGFDNRELKGESRSSRLYGYNDANGTSAPVDYTTFFGSYVNPFTTSRIPFVNSLSSTLNRAYSYFVNGSYSYKKRYIISLSARKDASNIFGVNTNQKIVPLWSTGIAWKLDEESFYKGFFKEQIPYLKLRVTYGFNGNVDNSLSAYTTARYATATLTPLQSAQIINPPNPDLRWEKVGVFNLGLDFETRNKFITGSLEYYRKNGVDLISQVPVTGISGLGLVSFSAFRKNAASTIGEGIDLVLNSQIINRQLKWDVNFLFSSIKEKVTNYDVTSAAQNYVDPDFTAPLLGRPLYAMYSFPWAGLDPVNGDPQGYLNGVVSKQYANIINASTTNSIIYHGSARPTVFGSLRNNLFCKGFSLSIMLTYRMGYYYRRTALSYSNRWTKPGDEKLTDEISFQSTLPLDANRTIFYLRSAALVERADNIRLNDVRLDYLFTKEKWKRLPVRSIQLFGYASNLGILWKSSSRNLDPDYPAAPPPSLSIAFGMNVQF